MPVERKSRRGRLERDRVGSNPCPDLPESQRLGDMRVLDRPPMPGQSGEHGVTPAEETQVRKARMAEQALDLRRKRPEGETVARCESRRGRPVFRAHAVIARPERDGDEPGRIAESHPCRKPHLDRVAARTVRAAQARRQGGGVVGDDEVARPNIDASAERGRWRILPSASAAKSRADPPSGRSASVMPAPRRRARRVSAMRRASRRRSPRRTPRGA